VVFSRPVGIIFLLSAVIVTIGWLFRNRNRKGAYILSMLCIAGLIGILYSPVTAFVNPDSLKRMEVICQVPEANAGIDYTEFNRAGLGKAFSVIKNEIGFGNFFMTGFKKLGNFFSMYRPYYSMPNNGLLLLYCLFYPFALIGIFSKQTGKYAHIRWVSIGYLCFTAVAIFFTCDDWANRFISPAFPFILLLAGGGVLSVRKYITV
jgi:hypothetical protein